MNGRNKNKSGFQFSNKLTKSLQKLKYHFALRITENTENSQVINVDFFFFFFCLS